MMIRFRLAHLEEMLAISKIEDILEVSQCREVEHVDIYTESESYEEVKQLLKLWKADMPHEAVNFRAEDGPEAVQVSNFDNSLGIDGLRDSKLPLWMYR